MSKSDKSEGNDVEDSLSGKVSEEKRSGSEARETCLNEAEGTSPKTVFSSNPGDDEVGKEDSPGKTGPAQSVNLASQNVTVVMSPKSSGQKTQTHRFISQEQIASLPIHTIHLPLKSSPIILKATTIPMPTKTVSIVAKPSIFTSPVKASSSSSSSSSAAAVPLTSKTPSKAASVHKGVIGVEKRESVSSSSKSGSSLHQKVKPGGVTKAKLHSAQVIVVPVQITKEMIAAKQKAAKMAKSASHDAEKRAKELSSKAENVDSNNGNGDSSNTGKSPGKQVKNSAVAKRTEDNEAAKNVNVKSKSQSKVSGKESKKLGSDESEYETEDIESETTTLEKLQKMSRDDKGGTSGIEKVNKKVSSKETKKKEEEKEEECDSEVDNEEIIKVRKIVKGRVGNKNLDDAGDEIEVKSPEKVKNKVKSADDSESEMDTDSKSKTKRGKTPKKGLKKEKDDEEADSEGDLNPKGRGKAAKKSQRKNESEDEAKITSESESKQDDDDDDDDDLDVKPSRKKKTKKFKEEKDKEERSGDSEVDDKNMEAKKTPGRPRKLKGESSSSKPKEELVLSTRRSKRESNLSVKLAEWGLVSVATSKASHLKLATPKSSPVASRAVSVSKHSAGARSSLAAGSPAVSSDDVSAPTSPGKPSACVTVTVIKPGADSLKTDGTSDAASPQSSKTLASNASEKQSAKSSMVSFDKAGSNSSALNVTGAVPKVTPRALKAEKSTASQSVKQVAKVTQEKAIVSKPAVQLKQLQNKSLMCKPIMMTKATSCNPIRIHKITQTGVSEAGRGKKKKTLFVPVPVPIALPSPVATCALPTPFPLPLPVPLPVPCFIPSSRKSIDGLMKSLQELHDQMPSDPFEVDLLTMAEAVTTAHSEVPDCIMEPDEVKSIVKMDPNIGVAATTAQCQTSGGELSEDVLEMALRMAQEIPEEGSVELETLKGCVANHPEASQTTEFGSIVRNGGIQHKRPAGDAERGSYKRVRPEASGGGSLCVPATAKALPMKDSHTKLKYSCGVKAWKHWVKEKNVELEKAAAALKVCSKLFKYEILQCSTEELNLALSLFVREVRKPTGEEYAPDTVYYLCLGIQYYLYENGRVDNIFSDVYYKGFSDALNNLLSAFQIRLNPHGIIICRITEEHLWESRQLGAHSPNVLLSTLVYLNTKYFMLNSTDAHLALMFANVVKQFKKNGVSSDAKQSQIAFLRYNSTAYADVNKQKGIEPPVNTSEQLENPGNPLRCPVKLYEFYLSKCPMNIRSRSELFYLTPEISSMPNSPVWYSKVPLGSEVMSKMLSRFQVVREIQEAFLHNMQPVFN